MTKKLLYLLSISLLIPGCYGNATMTNYYANRGLLTAMPSDLAEFDYKVVAMEYEPNAMADYDTSSRNGRESVVSELLKDKCASVEIAQEVREKHPEWKKGAFGPDQWWIMHVNCRN